MRDLTKWLSTALLAFLLLPLSAQEKSDTVYTFRFVPQDDMFYVPWSGNDKELARLESCVEQLKTEILSGKIPVLVNGYSTSRESVAENLAMAKVRSNRVKSELIVRQQLTEECFITRNHARDGDFVTVCIAVPVDNDKVEAERLAAERAEQQRKAAEESERQRLEQERIARERAEAERLAAKQARADSLARAQAAAESEGETASPLAEKASVTDSYTLSLRANLLRWAMEKPRDFAPFGQAGLSPLATI